MDILASVLGTFLGLSLGALGDWWLSRDPEARIDLAAPRARAAEIAKRVHELGALLEAREHELVEMRQRASGLSERLVRTTAELDGERRSTAERSPLLQHAEQTLREAFASVSAEAVRANN